MILEYEADVREPYMGNTLPVKVLIKTSGGEVVDVEVETHEGGRRTGKFVGATLPTPPQTFNR